MKCSNCDKTIKSKQQCAYCGQVFNDSIEQQTVLPKTKKRKRSILNLVVGGLKVVLTLLVLFGAFLYAPKAIDFVMNYLNSTQQQVVQSSQSTQESEAESSSQEEPQPALTIANKNVSISQYPLVEIKVAFNEPLTDVVQNTFEFAVKANGQQQVLTQYSLVKEDKTLTIRYNDPTHTEQAGTSKEATFEMFAPNLNFSHSITYELPSQAETASVIAKLKTATESLNVQANKVSAGYATTIPVYTNSESVEASTMITWFVLQRVYEDIASGKLTAEKEIVIEDSLKASGDQGEIAQLPAGEVVSVEQLIIAAVQIQDVTALNHLIQAVGGPNEFNSWLKQKDYFATEVTNLLQVTASNGVQGAKTSTLDLMKLLTALSKGQLINAEMDAKFKEALLQTPLSEKYPSNLSGVIRRYEITSADTDTTQQHYAAFFEAGDKQYVVVLLLDGVKDSVAAVSAVATAITSIMQDVAGLEATSEVTEEATSVTEEPVYTEETYENTQPAEEYVAPPVTEGTGE